MADKSYKAQIDRKKVRETVEHAVAYLSGAMESGMIYLGDRLGLYQALAGAGPMTSEELAQKTGLHERWLREWLQGQATAKLLDYPGDGRFELSAEAALVLADENSPAFVAGGFCSLPQQMAVLERLPESFKTGLGLPYDAFGSEGARQIERMAAPWLRAHLVPRILPLLDGVVSKLEAGGKVVDVGCGTVAALIEMAKVYPRSDFHGYDISQPALERAEENRAQAGVRNVTFHDASRDPLPEDHSIDFVTTFDCLHDMAHPSQVIHNIMQAIKPDGNWLIADINTLPSFEENMAQNPLASMWYGFSVLCCMSSAMSEPNSEGLGTLGFTEPVAQKMVQKAGFMRFKRLEVNNLANAYYEVRP